MTARIHTNIYGALFYGLLAGMIASIAQYFLVDGLSPTIRVDIWEHSLSQTLAYGLLVGAAATHIWTVKPTSIRASIPLVFGLIAFGGLFGALTPIGFPTGACVAGALVASLWILRLALRRDRAFGRPSFPELITTSAAITIMEGGFWTWLTAPAHAEGFVLLSWLLLGVLNTGVLLLSWLGLFAMRIERATSSALWTLAISWAVIAGIGAMTLYWMIYAEGADYLPLEEPMHWPGSFVPLPEPSHYTENLEGREWKKRDIVELLASKERKTAVDLATLAMLTKDRRWANGFKSRLIALANQFALTGPENSVKVGQHHATTVGLFYPLLDESFPGLFSPEERMQISNWLELVLSAIFETGWVDYLYAIPFRISPTGPYLNQEVGAGAVAAILPLIKDRDTPLQRKARDHLARMSIGWRGNFRNQDDTLNYQDLWMQSAYALFSLADNSDPSAAPGLPQAVEWVKAQIPTSAFPLNYGYPAPHRPLDVLAFGAFLLRDGESRWLLDRQLDAMQAQGERLPSNLLSFWLWDDSIEPIEPRRTSILINAPSGYAFRPGRLEPDKLVFRRGRDGTQYADLFALVGMRNAGWHRYPASNTLVTLMHGGSALLAEDIVDRWNGWLPKGRAKHRDKRIDRSRLNGLNIARTGFDRWVGGITGVYSRWRQDVPNFAAPVAWAQAGAIQVAQVDLTDWAGAQQRRWYLSWPNFGFVVVDDVLDTENREKAIGWHLAGPAHLASKATNSASAPDSGIGLHILTTGDSTVEAEEIANWDDPAYPASAPHTRIRVAESSRRLTVAAVADLTGDTRPTLARDPNGQVRLHLRKDGVDALAIFRGNDPIFYDGLRSDAKVMVINEERDARRVALFEATFLEVGEEKTTGTWEGRTVHPQGSASGKLFRVAEKESPVSGTFILLAKDNS